MSEKPNNERPADLAVQDSVGGMAKRLLNDLARRGAATLHEQGAEQLWRDVKFRVGLALHHDDWRHRADIPLKRELKAQRAANLQGPKISIIVPLYNTPAKFFDEMLRSVTRQTYQNWELVLVDASDDAHPDVAKTVQARRWKTAVLRPTPPAALRWPTATTLPCWTTTMCCT